MKFGCPESMREAAKILNEDAADCWGIRRKMNLRAAARHLRAAASRIEELENPRRRIGFRLRKSKPPSDS
jgi:hypothetical protein